MSDNGVVFVVDDDESVRKALARLISSVGLEVESFPTPKAFLAHRRPDRPGCLVLDLRMPGGSGLALQEELARSGADLPILFLTGHADVPTSVRAMKAGAV
ncbi:MAG TPA: response regulator, partial [Methylomirabilota bacterium]|nr:response regulator [Methylomirabilota bacterium]